MQLGLSLIWSEAKKRGIDLPQVMQWMASAPADLAGLPTKGRIALGCDADFAIFEPESAQIVDVNRLHHKNPVSPPYDGRALAGVVKGDLGSRSAGGLRDRPRTDDPPRRRLRTLPLLVE